MTARDRKDLEFAMSCGYEALTGVRSEERWAGLMALRTVAFHLDMKDLHAQFDNELDQVLRAS